MFGTCRNHCRPFVARLILAGKQSTCRPSLTNSPLQYQQPRNWSSFLRYSHSLLTGMKIPPVCLYRVSCYKARPRMFSVGLNNSNNMNSIKGSSRFLPDNLYPSSYRCLSRYHDKDNTNSSKTKDLFNLKFLSADSLIRPIIGHCPHHAVISSFMTFKTSLFLNPRLSRPFISHSPNDAKFYGTQTNGSTNPQPTSSSPVHLDKDTESKKTKTAPLTTADLKEDIQTIPNLLTCCRMASAPFLSYLVLNGSYSWALGLLMLAGVTDLLDGYIARNFKNQNTMLGTALDPLADKILISFLTVSLTMVDLIPFPLLLIIIGRDLGLIGAVTYIRYITLPPPKTFRRFMDITHSTAELSPLFLSKVNTAIQLSLLALSVAAPVFGYVDHILLKSLWYITASTTILSGCSYVHQRKKVIKILNKNSNSY